MTKPTPTLPAVTGTEKQVEWAETIRRFVFCETLAETYATAARRATTTKTTERAEARRGPARITLAIIDSLATQSSAKYWIETRGVDFGTLIVRIEALVSGRDNAESFAAELALIDIPALTTSVERGLSQLAQQIQEAA